MNKFIKSNSWISIIFSISILIIILYMFSIGLTEWFVGAGRWFDLAFQLSIGFIINFLFYVTQVYIPNAKTNENAKACVVRRVDKIIESMNSMFKYTIEVYIPNHKGDIYSKEDIDILKNIRLKDKTNVSKNIKLGNGTVDITYFTVKEWINRCRNNTISEIDNLYKYYANFISVELMDILEEILYSDHHQSLPITLNIDSKNDINIQNLHKKCFEDYFHLMNKLKKISKSL